MRCVQVMFPHVLVETSHHLISMQYWIHIKGVWLYSASAAPEHLRTATYLNLSQKVTHEYGLPCYD